MGIRYRQAKDGDKSVIPFEGVRMVACCDCGLTHRHVYSVEDKKIVERTYRANRATATLRRAMARRGDIMAERLSNVYVVLPRINAQKPRKRVNAQYEPA